MTIDEFLETLSEDVRIGSEANGLSIEEAFFARVTDTVTESGEVGLLEYFHHRGSPSSGIRVDGWGSDPGRSGQLTLCIVSHSDEPDGPVLTGSELNAIFRRPLKFLQNALEDDWRNALEETSPGFELADAIAAKWSTVQKIRLLLLTNRRLSSRIDGREMTEFRGRPVAYSVWDATRLHKLEASSLAREDIVVDLDDHGGPVPILPAHMPGSPYGAYLSVFPGAVLASIYDRWEARLLESNVRVFLQARGNVNKGIRKTIEDEPQMFFAYNNGITATAEAIETEERGGGTVMTRIRNLQIVNGGQTTASIHAALRARKDLSGIFVQAKLSVVDAEQAERIVPDISRYANSQNRIAAADFFSNHPFHMRMEEISRRLYAPAREGVFTQSRWFYERARGQFADRRSGLTAAETRKFDLEHPRAQVFTKTDLAKAEMTWRRQPDVVSKGAQKNFAFFASAIGREWEKSDTGFNEEWFRDAVAKLIVFRRMERIVSDAAGRWYTGGLRANTVCYAISKLVHDLDAEGQALDLRAIWTAQDITPELTEVLDACGEVLHLHLLDPRGGSNPTEWAKRRACWTAVEGLEIERPADLSGLLIDAGERRARRSEGRKDQKMVDGIEAQAAVVELGAAEWTRLREWITATGMKVSPAEAGILDLAERIRLKPLSEAQARRAMEVRARTATAGYGMASTGDGGSDA